eukprot:snap_masked-scaffold_10-processed-gene-13.45-mRNA-1 protein AED:1.00 eAED:1.00 QI:0/-1/0/0/-1/1/1/0/73
MLILTVDYYVLKKQQLVSEKNIYRNRKDSDKIEKYFRSKYSAFYKILEMAKSEQEYIFVTDFYALNIVLKNTD